MASNGRMGFRSGSPSFLIIGLSLVIVVLLYSYWSVSSRNSMLLRDQTFLQDRLRALSTQKSKVEQKYVAARSQMTNVEKAKRQLEAKDMSSSKKQSQLDMKVKLLENELRSEKQKLANAKKEGEKSKIELSKLKSDIESTNMKFKQISAKANSMMDMHKKLQTNLQLQSKELMQAKNDREMLKVQLDHSKEALKNKPRPENKERPQNREINLNPENKDPTKRLSSLGNNNLVPGKSLDEKNASLSAGAAPNSSVELPTEQSTQKSSETPTGSSKGDEDENNNDEIERHLRNPQARENVFKKRMGMGKHQRRMPNNI